MAVKYATNANPNVDGTSGDDQLYGNNLANILRGFAGSDLLYGNDGNDDLWGGSNNDYLYGGKGDDRLRGELGNDTLTGNEGADRYSFSRDGGKDTVTDLNPSEGDRIVFGEGVNLLFGSTGVPTKGTTYKEFDFNWDGKVDKTVVYLDYVGDTSGNDPDYITFLYASWADVRATLPSGELIA